MLTVAIDATPLLGERTGIGVATGGWVRGLGTRPDVDVVGYGLTTKGWPRLRSALPDGVKAARAPMPAGALLRVWSQADHPVVERWVGRVHVVHGTNFVVPPACRAARLVTVWDLTPVRYPQWRPPAARRYPALIRRALEAGAWIHTGAETVAAEIVDHFGVDPARVRAIPPGLDVLAPDDLLATRPVEAPYVLGLGRVEPRKDFPGLVAAFDAVAAAHPDLELRLAGPSGWGDSAMEAAVAGAAHRSRIRRLGWVDDVRALIAGAAVFAYPSRYEGFGIPPLEAMALGVPVVATAVGALPEVLGDAAVLVPAGDADALGAAISAVLDDGDLQRRLVAAGRDRAAAYSWPAAVEALVETYRDMLAGPARPR